MLTPLRRVFEQRDQALAQLRAIAEKRNSPLVQSHGGSVDWDGALRQAIHDKDPYQEFIASPLPYDAQEDWGGENMSIVRLVSEYQPNLIIEVGTWKGCSAMSMCKTLRNLGIKPTIICVDTWGGIAPWLEKYATSTSIPLFLTYWKSSVADIAKESSWPGYLSAYDQFMSNVIHRGMTEDIVPFPIDGRLAVKWFLSNHVKAHLIYIDAAHEYEDAIVDIPNYWQLVQAPGVLMGDDFHPMWPGIMKAVHEFAMANNLKFTVDGNTWSIRKDQ